MVSEGRGSTENCNLLIRSLGERNNLDAALEVHDKMERLGFERNEDTYTSLILACKRNAEAARKTWLKMRENLVTPTQKAYTALMKCHARMGDVESVFSIIRKMEDEDVLPDCPAWTVAIDSLVKAGRYELAWEQFWAIRTWKAIKPDEVLMGAHWVTIASRMLKYKEICEE